MRPDSGPDAVLWDMDGTLVDTEPYWIEAEYALVAEHGGHWSEEDSRALIGNPLLVSADYLREHGGVDLEPLQIVHRLQDHVVAAVERATHWRPGARELLLELVRAGVPCALVTMSWEPLAQAVVRQLPPGTFATVVTGDQVSNGKPHPEPYTTALQLIGARPQRCVAIEDSTTGVTSAEAAGVPTIAVPHLVPIPQAPGRHLVASLEGLRLADLRRLLSARAGMSEP